MLKKRGCFKFNITKNVHYFVKKNTIQKRVSILIMPPLSENEERFSE